MWIQATDFFKKYILNLCINFTHIITVIYQLNQEKYFVIHFQGLKRTEKESRHGNHMTLVIC